jgi:hypothetical protein
LKFNKHQLRQISPYLLIGAFYIVAMAVVGVGGDFPLNDDWAYAEGVRHLLLGEGLQMPYVNAAALVHVGLGLVAAKLWGYSYTSLRICSVLVSFAGAIALYIAAGFLRIPRVQGAFLAILYAANPVLVNVSFGFMSDSTGLTLNMIFLACLLCALVKGSSKVMVLAFVVLALAVTVRQSALIFILLSPFCLSRRFGDSPYRYAVLAVALALPVASMWACDNLLLTAQLDSGSSYNDYEIVRQAHFATLYKLVFAAPDMVLPAIGALGQVLCYLGLFCIPTFPALVSSMVASSKESAAAVKLTVGLSLLLISSAMVTIFLYHKTMPFSENILRFTTVGAQGILGIIRQPLVAQGRVILTVVSFLTAIPLVMSFSWLTRLLLKKPLSWRVLVLVVCLFVCLMFLTLETFVLCSDRYYLIILGPALLSVGYVAARLRQQVVTPVSIVLLLAFTLYSLAGNQEYLSASRARWRAIDWLEVRGIKPDVIDGGYEYNVLRDMAVYTSKYRGDAPRDSWRWWPIKGESYLISFSPVPGYKTIHTEPYFSLLDFKLRNIEVLEQIVDGR